MALLPLLTGFNWDFEFIKIIFGNAVYDSVSNFSSAKPKEINAIWYTVVGYNLLNNAFLYAIKPHTKNGEEMLLMK